MKATKHMSNFVPAEKINLLPAYNVSVDHMKDEMLKKWRKGEEYQQAEEIASRNSTWLEKEIWLLKVGHPCIL